jgi:flagellar hook-associated protein 3 FlgL
MVDRISSFTQTNYLISSNLRLQGSYSESQIQLSSGMKSQDYAGIAKDATRLLNLESDYDRITQQSENAQLALDRSEMMYSALGSILDAARNFSADLSATVSGFGLEGTDLINNAETTLSLIAGSLNVTLADRYLFSGSATNTAPVDVNAAGFGGQIYVAPVPSSPDTGYYQGNDYVHRVEASDSFTVNYGVNADNPAFEKMIRALDLIITTPNDQATLNEAFRVLEEGLDDVAVLQASISQKTQTIDLQIVENLEVLNLIDNEIVDIREIDAAEVSVKLKQLEAQLEASYSVTTDLIKLNLADYIR